MYTTIYIILIVLFLAILGYRYNKKETERHADVLHDNAPAGEDTPAEEDTPVEENTPAGEDMAAGEDTVLPGASARSASPTSADTLELMLRILTEIGCQPKRLDDGELHVQFQGENFRILFGGAYAQIWDLPWADFNTGDSDYGIIMEAVNRVNGTFGPTLVFCDSDEEKGKVELVSRMDIVLVPELPHIDEYVKSSLTQFFRAKESLRSAIFKLKSQAAHPGGFPGAAPSPN